MKSHKWDYGFSNFNDKFKILQYVPKLPYEDVALVYTSLGINQG